jgi:hypothetical protein
MSKLRVSDVEESTIYNSINPIRRKTRPTRHPIIAQQERPNNTLTLIIVQIDFTVHCGDVKCSYYHFSINNMLNLIIIEEL